MAKSWFYLTLWKGTPKEFTSEYNVQIKERDSKNVTVKQEDRLSTAIGRRSKADVIIHEKGRYSSTVNITTEVVWYVGKHHGNGT